MDAAVNKTVNQILSQANAAFQSKDLSSALRLTEQALSVAPLNAAALSFKLGLLLSTRQTNKADETVMVLLSEQCEINDLQLFVNTAQTLLRFSRFQHALMVINAGFKVFKQSPVLQALGVKAAIEARDLDTASLIANDQYGCSHISCPP